MKKKKNISGNLLKIATLITGVVILSSCTDNKIGITKVSNIQNLPTYTAIDFETVYTDSAQLQIIMSTPLLERYTTIPPAYTEFTKGIHIVFYDGKKEPVATISAKYAKCYEEKNLWELRDSVVAQSDKKLETELLYWDRVKDLVYTERFVKITKEDEIIMGTGFESNSKFTSYTLKNTSATIYR